MPLSSATVLLTCWHVKTPSHERDFLHSLPLHQGCLPDSSFLPVTKRLQLSGPVLHSLADLQLPCLGQLLLYAAFSTVCHSTMAACQTAASCQCL